MVKGGRWWPKSSHDRERQTVAAIRDLDRWQRSLGGKHRWWRSLGVPQSLRPLGAAQCIVRGAAGNAVNLGGCKSLYRQLPETDGEHIHCSER